MDASLIGYFSIFCNTDGMMVADEILCPISLHQCTACQSAMVSVNACSTGAPIFQHTAQNLVEISSFHVIMNY